MVEVDEVNLVVESPSQVINVVSVGTQGPQGVPGGSGGVAGYRTKDADYYIDLTQDSFVAVNASNGNVTIYLPVSSSSNAGLAVTIKKTDSTIYTVIVSTQNGQQIDGDSSTFILDDEDETYIFTSSGSGYSIS